ncbi:MAG TPA: class I SAM-dependent methyltransferase [Pyrinomonadaceae bacterium]|jgi:ubiquinone/menaquinone biosynthesis C-methylase UbiE|nr:class I SAM-dependent methyltransferase [Pyrinomonadaceae bacterium]
MSLAQEKLRAREQWGQDPCGAEYDREHELGTREFFDQIERHRYQEYAAWMPRGMEFEKFSGARLLEIGCGMGTDLLQFARGGARCTGIDLTPRSVEITRHRFRLYGADGRFMISDGEHLPFQSESFDVVYSNGVLHHTPDTAGAIREVHRVLRPGGTAKVMLYHRNSLNYWIEIVLRRGVLGLEFLRGRSAEEIMSRVIEFSDHDTRPLVKVYSRKQAGELFSMFKDARVDVEQLTRAELRFLSPIVSESVLDKLRKKIGWNVIVTAIK